MSDADVLEAINVDTYPDGMAVSLEAVFGNTVKYNSTTGDVTSARAMMQVSRGKNKSVQVPGDTLGCRIR